MVSIAATFYSLISLPELFPLIACHLPLYATPSSLLSLALTNRAFHGVIINLLYKCIILRNEFDTVNVIQRILDDPQLGEKVRELHIQSELSLASINGQTAFDAVKGLRKLVHAGHVPFIHTLELRLLSECKTGDHWYGCKGFGHLPMDFWEDLSRNCPRLESISLSGIGEKRRDEWLTESGIYELKGLGHLSAMHVTFALSGQTDHKGTDRLIKSALNQSYSSSLHTLVLGFNLKADSVAPVLAMSFPNMRYLHLHWGAPQTSEAMAFWIKHPLIETLKLTNTGTQSRWFDEKVSEDLLPKLKYLETTFRDAVSLIPILPRLIGLSIHQSINSQVPYLIRELIPGGLPNIKSLEIDQEWSEDRQTLRSHKGSLWYETPDGKFAEHKRFSNAARNFADGYLSSIVLGAPNIEELCLHGINLDPKTIASVTSTLAQFPNLRRLYYRGNYDPIRSSSKDREIFHEKCRSIAEQCSVLEMITDINSEPFLAVKIKRKDDGVVEDTRVIQGRGTLIGSEDQAFPTNPDPLLVTG